MQNNPSSVIVLGDFNVRSNYWCKNGITTNVGKAIENISSKFDLYQVINEPTYIVESSSYIDLIFTSQPNLITEISTRRPSFQTKLLFRNGI